MMPVANVGSNSKPNSVHLTVIIPTLCKLATAQLLADRIFNLLPALKVEVIIVTPIRNVPPGADGRLRYVADSGGGVYGAYKAGMQCASGNYLWFMGDDDFPLDAAECISESVTNGSEDLLVAPVLLSSGRIYRPTRSLLLLHFLNWCQQGVIYRRSVLARRTFFRRLRVQADQYVNILLRADSAVRIKFMPQAICVFGVNGVSGRIRDVGFAAVRIALARRTLGRGSLLMFRGLMLLEPLIKRLWKVR